MNIGDIVIPWGNRQTTNKVHIQKIVKAKVVVGPTKNSRWDTKKVMVIEILEGTAKSNRDGMNHRTLGDRSYNMPSNWGVHHHSVGHKLIVYVDGFQVSSKAEEETMAPSEASTPVVGMSDTFKKLNKDTLMCMLG